MTGLGVVTVIPKGEECDVEWKMNFASVWMDVDVGFSSRDFCFEDESWQLMLWLNENEDPSTRCFDIGLNKHFSNNPPIDVEISFSLKTVNGKKRFKRQNKACFEGKSSIEEVPMLLSKSDLKKRQSEFLSSGFLTLVCTLRRLNSTGSASGSAAAECTVNRYIEKTPVSAEEISSYEKKCRVKCPDCLSLIPLRKWHDHKCQMSTAKECSYCRKNMVGQDISRHEKKCMDRPIKCPDCSEVVLLQKWHDHDNECQAARVVECSYCRRNVVGQDISTHEKKCMDRPIKCPECSEVVLLQKWHDHECQAAGLVGKTNASRSSEVRHHDKILQDFKQVFLKQENCDVALRVKGREFQAHKIILAARSPVFESTFRNDMKEKETGIVDIEDCDPSIFPDFLSFLYSDGVDSLSEENVFGLFTAADKYDIPDLRKLCLEFIKENLSIEIFCETITLALQHSQTELVHLATDFFIKNAEKILVTVKWLSFAAENPTQSNELVIKLVASYKCSES